MSRFINRPFTSRPLSRSPTADPGSGSATVPESASEKAYPLSVGWRSTIATGWRKSSALKYASITVAITLEERIITVSAARLSISAGSILHLFGVARCLVWLPLHGQLLHVRLFVFVMLRRIKNDRIHFRPPFAPGQRALDHAGHKFPL